MKSQKMLLLACLFFGIVGVNSKAEEFAQNPDRMPSVGFALASGGESGTFTVRDSGFSAPQDLKTTTRAFVIDARVPVSNSVTLNGAVGFTGTNVDANETNILAGGKTDTSGVSLSIGVRFYLH